MVIGANSLPTGIPNLECSEGNFISADSSVAMAHVCETSIKTSIGVEQLSSLELSYGPARL